MASSVDNDCISLPSSFSHTFLSPAVLYFLLQVSFLVDEGVSPVLLQLLSCALCGSKVLANSSSSSGGGSSSAGQTGGSQSAQSKSSSKKSKKEDKEKDKEGEATKQPFTILIMVLLPCEQSWLFRWHT